MPATMLLLLQNTREAVISTFDTNDTDKLVGYLQGLSEISRNRFGPHAFDAAAIASFYRDESITGYIATTANTGTIVAYAVVKRGCLAHDAARLQSYAITPSQLTDCTFAPSVADDWQGCGLGNSLFQFVVKDQAVRGVKRIILWGGVQAGNEKAVGYYKKNNFRWLGSFYHNGGNHDMICDIAD